MLIIKAGHLDHLDHLDRHDHPNQVNYNPDRSKDLSRINAEFALFTLSCSSGLQSFAFIHMYCLQPNFNAEILM